MPVSASFISQVNQDAFGRLTRDCVTMKQGTEELRTDYIGFFFLQMNKKNQVDFSLPEKLASLHINFTYFHTATDL